MVGHSFVQSAADAACLQAALAERQPKGAAPLGIIAKIETIRANVLGMLNLADICNTAGIHLTTYATGCIFHYDDAFPEGSGKGFKESDKPNFTGSYYSYTKAMVESLLKEYPNVLVLRVRMPIVGDLVYPRNFVAKILRYEKIVNIPNSMTVLPELLPMSIEMAKRGLTGKKEEEREWFW